MTTSTDENVLLSNFLNGDTLALEMLVELMEPRVRRMAKSIARDLPCDIQHEITQQTFANLFSATNSDFDPSRGTAWQFLIGRVLNAEKQVRRSYEYPPRRKNTRSLMSVRPIYTAEYDSEIPSPNSGKTIEERIFVREVIRMTSRRLAFALNLICYADVSKKDAARLTGLSRFQLHRGLRGLKSVYLT